MILELIAGILLQSMGFGLGLPLVLRFALSLAVSCYYEKYLDRNGWSLSDVSQRFLGSVLLEGVKCLA